MAKDCYLMVTEEIYEAAFAGEAVKWSVSQAEPERSPEVALRAAS
jgi:hypothetical protein